MRVDRLTGLLLVITTALVVLHEWQGARLFAVAAAVSTTLLLALLAGRVGWSRRVFLVVGAGLLVAAVATRPEWPELLLAALGTSAFITAFFTALATLRNAAATSPSIEACGRFLAQQPPGRRYLALTVGGHLFALILNYGSIVLLGSLAEANARHEPNPEIRTHRIRRMLLAIQRGFVSTLAWSPMAFAMAISTSLVPGASWAAAAPPCLVTALILAGLGWGLDTVFKPRLSTPPPPRSNPEGSWARVWPLVVLLALLITVAGGLHVVTGIRAVAVVMLVVPLIALGWSAIQDWPGGLRGRLVPRVAKHVTRELPGYRSELVLLMMAGFIGTLGSHLLAPLVASSGIDLTALPAWQVLVGLVWLIPLAGQAGMNPILIVSLIAPLLPDAASLGVSPTAMIVAITAGWALSGASSPYTATTLLIGAIGRVSARHVGLVWNGAYTLTAAVVLSAWVVLFALL